MNEQEEAEKISVAMSILGSRSTPRKAATSAENITAYHKQPRSEEYLQKLRDGQARRRQREAQQKQAQGLAPAPSESEKRGRGRPRSTPAPPADAPKRGRGRPANPKPDAPKREG